MYHLNFIKKVELGASNNKKDVQNGGLDINNYAQIIYRRVFPLKSHF